MTREKAIKMLEYIKHVGNGESEYKNDAQAIALDMAIKALEQEPTATLDKIKSEIAEYGSIWVAYAITDKTKTDKGIEELVTDVLSEAKRQVLGIIDKYKAENE